MIELDHTAAGIPVRQDIIDTHRLIWEHVRAPGNWWTGTQRVAMAAEARRRRPAPSAARKALSPSAVIGEHVDTGALPPNVVDVVHRIRTDPGRLSRAWFEGVGRWSGRAALRRIGRGRHVGDRRRLLLPLIGARVLSLAGPGAGYAIVPFASIGQARHGVGADDRAGGRHGRRRTCIRLRRSFPTSSGR